MSRAGVWASIALLLAWANASRADGPAPSVKGAIDKALPLLVKGAKGHAAKRTCFGCHNQGIAMLALTSARARGFTVPKDHVKQQLEHIAAFLAKHRDRYRKGQGQGGQADTAG